MIVLWFSLEKGEFFYLNHSLGCSTLYITRLLGQVYHLSLLVCYHIAIYYSKIMPNNRAGRQVPGHFLFSKALYEVKASGQQLSFNKFQ